MDVLEADAINMSHEETPGGEFAKHGELWVFIYLLWHILRSPKRHVSHTFRGSTRIADMDILERDVLDSVIGNATNAAGEGVVEVVNLRPSQVVSLIWPSKRHLALEVANGDIPQRTPSVANPLPKTEEDGIACILGLDALHDDIIYLCPIHTLDGDGRAEGVEHTDVADADMVETTPGG